MRHFIGKTTLFLLTLLAASAGLVGCAGSQTEKAKALVEQGCKDYYDSDIIGALNHLQAAMDAARKEGNDEAYFTAGVYMVMTYELTGRSEDAYELLKSLDYMENTQPETFASQYYYRMKALFLAKIDGDFEASATCGKEVIELDRRLYPQDTAYVYIELANLGETYLMGQDYEHLQEVVDEFERSKPMDYGLYLVGYCYLKSSLLYHHAAYDSAYHYAERGVEYSRQYDAADNEILQLRLLCSIDSLRADMENYMRHRNELEARTTQLRGTQVNYQIAALKGKIQLEQKEFENRRTRTMHVVIIAAMVLVIIALVIVIHALRRAAETRRRMAEVEKQRLDTEIERQRLERELLELKMRQNEEKLDHAYKHNVSMSIQLAEIAKNSDSIDKLSALELNLREQQADFLERVKARFPQLTDNDVRLAGFIRMNIKTQAMATALGISVSSLNTARYRLRKKLGLAPEDDLKRFVDGI